MAPGIAQHRGLPAGGKDPAPYPRPQGVGGLADAWFVRNHEDVVPNGGCGALRRALSTRETAVVSVSSRLSTNGQTGLTSNIPPRLPLKTRLSATARAAGRCWLARYACRWPMPRGMSA